MDMHSQATQTNATNAATASSMANLVAWAAANSIGLSVALSVPLWIGDFSPRFGLPSWGGGVAATVEMALAALGNICWASLCPRYPRRWIVFGLVATIAVAQQLVATNVLPLACVGLLAAGLCSGSLLAVLNRQVALSHAPHRGFAILSFLHVGYGVALYLVAPQLQAHFGSNALFHLLSGLALIGAPLMYLLPLGQSLPLLAGKVTTGRASLPGVMGLVCLASLLAGHETVAAFLVGLGAPHGLSRIEVSSIMAAASAVGLLGPVLAGLLPARLGYASLIAPALLGMALIDIGLRFAEGAALFAGLYIGLQVLLVFAVPRLLGYLAILDGTGRSAAMGPASLLIGSALGPVLGNLVGAPETLQGVPLAAAGTVVLSLLIIGGIAFRHALPFKRSTT